MARLSKAEQSTLVHFVDTTLFDAADKAAFIKGWKSCKDLSSVDADPPEPRPERPWEYIPTEVIFVKGDGPEAWGRDYALQHIQELRELEASFDQARPLPF